MSEEESKESIIPPPAERRHPSIPPGQVGLGGIDPARPVERPEEPAAQAAVHEFMDQATNPQHPLGPFSDPHSTMIAGIEEHVGYVPRWCLLLMITAVLLAMIMWYPTSY